MAVTPEFNLPYPEPSSTTDVPRDFKALAEAVESAMQDLSVEVLDVFDSTDKTLPPSADALRRGLETKQNTVRLADNWLAASVLVNAAPDAQGRSYPDGLSFFKVSSSAGGWPTANGYVETKRAGSGGSQTFYEMYTGAVQTDKTARVWTRSKRDSNAFWQDWARVLTEVDLLDYIRQPGYAATAGTGAAYTAALSPQPTALVDGLSITIVPHAVNTVVDPTLKIGTLGALPIRRQSGGTFAAGTIKAGAPLSLVKVGNYFLARSAPAIGTATAAQVLSGKTFQSEAHPDGGIGTATEYSNNARPVSPAATPGAGSDSVNFYVKVPPGWYDDTVYVRWNDPNFVASNILEGKTVHGLAGSIPVLSGARSPTGTAQWGNGDLAVYMQQNAYYTGAEMRVSVAQLQAAEPELYPAVIRRDYTIFGVTGTLDPQMYYETTFVQNGNGGTWTVTVNFGFEPTVVSIETLESGITYNPFGSFSNNKERTRSNYVIYSYNGAANCMIRKTDGLPFNGAIPSSVNISGTGWAPATWKVVGRR